MRTWLAHPLAILVPADVDGRGGIVVENDRIAEVLPAGAEPALPVDVRFDAGGLVVLPGLINTHHHFYQTLTRACPAALDKELFAWLKSLYPIWAGLDEDMIHVATRLAAAELLLSGCTTTVDHHYIFPENARQALDVQVDAIRATGIRAVLTRGSMSLGEDQGGLPPRSTIQAEDAILADCERVIDQFHDRAAGAMLQIALAPCSPFSVTEGLMRDTAILARSWGVRLHTHLGETGDEDDFCLATFGVRPAKYLERVGWMDSDVWLAHGIHFRDEEIVRLGRAGVGVCHCPSSNMVLGSGICRTRELEKAGCPVGLGVDGSASNDCSNLVQEVRQALLIGRLRYGSAALGHKDALRWATAGSAACLGRDDIGAIAPGKQADLALFALDEPRFSGAGDPLAALVLCGAHRATHVMVAGQWRVRDDELLGMDLERLRAEHEEAARGLLQAGTGM
jgi:8-oxoguanine deaminase